MLYFYTNLKEDAKMQKETMLHGVDHEKENATGTNARLIAYGEKMGLVKRTGTAGVKKGGNN